jgi:hypothetical protein
VAYFQHPLIELPVSSLKHYIKQLILSNFPSTFRPQNEWNRCLAPSRTQWITTRRLTQSAFFHHSISSPIFPLLSLPSTAPFDHYSTFSICLSPFLGIIVDISIGISIVISFDNIINICIYFISALVSTPVLTLASLSGSRSAQHQHQY